MRDEDELVHIGEDEEVDEQGYETSKQDAVAERKRLGLAGQKVLVLELKVKSR